VRALSVGLPLSLSCLACGPTPATDLVTIAVRADSTGFFPNPPLVNEGFSMDVNWNVFEGLVRFDRQFRLEPALAARWENPDERTYLFDLRDDLRFSDGRPVRAEDVAASLLAPQRRAWVTRDYLQAIESARALSPTRVEVKTRFPYLILLSKLPWALVVPADAIDKTPVPAVGTGPYTLEAWTPGVEFSLRRNPHFRGPRPAFERARFVVVPDAHERLRQLRAGTVDVVDQVPLDALPAVAADETLSLHAGPGNRVLYLGLAVDRPPFSDRRVREAFDIALDRRTLVERALGGRAAPAAQLVPATIVGFNPDLGLPVRDLPRARRLLAEAGHAKGLRVRLDGPRNRYVNDVGILHEVARQLGEVGVTVEVNAMDKSAFFALVDGRQSDLHLLGWACQTGEAGDVLDSIAHTRDGFLGNGNTDGISDPELDRLIDESNASRSLRERTAPLQAAMLRLRDEHLLLPLVVQTEAVAVLRVESLRPVR
jgi:peptide/nickel transport system substrate-binding protein